MQKENTREVKVFIASDNPVKIRATKEGFGKFFQKISLKGIPVDSGVPAQPMGEQTFRGAMTRVRHLKEYLKAKSILYDFLVGIEGGVIVLNSRHFALGVVYIEDSDGDSGWGTSPLFELPVSIVEELKRGKELGEVMDELTGVNDSKRKFGAVGYFTRGVVTRSDFYRAGIIMALIPLLSKNLYKDAEN